MAKTVFVDGTVVTPEFLNAINNPVFVDNPNYDGEIDKLTNDDFSTEPGQLLPEWEAFRDEIKVTAGTGLTATHTGGKVLLPNNTIATVAPGVLSLANDATNFVYVGATGTVGVATSLPLISLPLARIVTVAGQISGSVVDLRPRHRAMARQDALRIFGGSGDQGDYTLASGSAMLADGEYYYRNLTIGEGATLNISQGAILNISGNLTIAGTVAITTVLIGGAGITGSIPGAYFQSGAGVGRGGVQFDVGSTYNPSVSRTGSSGGSGQLYIPSGGGNGTGGGGGSGGGFLEINCGGDILITGSILCKGGNGIAGSYGAGEIGVSGGGGGSGGSIILRSLGLLRVQGTLDVRGGNGSAGISAGYGGGGGGGGVVVLMGTNINTTGSTMLLAGGARGANSGGALYAAGCGGSFGGVGGDGVNVAAGAGQLLIRSFLPVG